MKQIKELKEMIKYFTSRHPDLFNENRGVSATKIIRRESGQRIAFEKINHFTLSEVEQISDNCIRMQTKIPISHHIETVNNTFLYNLVLINIFDNRAEFITQDGIDFAYCLTDFASSIETISEWIGSNEMPVRARWESDRKDLQNVLDIVGYPEKILFKKPRGRHSCLDLNNDLEII